MRWGMGAKVGGAEGGKSVVMRSRLKWIGLLGLFLSVFSLSTHFFLAKYTDYGGISDYQSSSSSSSFVTIFSWRPVFDKNANLLSTSPIYRRLWGPVPQLQSLHPHANPRGDYAAPNSQSTGFVFFRIQGGFHKIRTGICDAVVVARLLNATLVVPEILSATSSKGISSQFKKSFAYLYNEDQFMAALEKDVNIVRNLPKHLKEARRKRLIPAFRVPSSASPYFYLHQVLPVLKKHSVVELVVSDGGCLQALFPPHLEEYQRLRCRVSYHALRYRQEVQELATSILNRLRAPGRPFIAFDPGLTREALAFHGCAELFQDVHTELIQHKRTWMLKRGIVKGDLSVNSARQKLNGSCPPTPEEIGILLRAYGYSADTIIYVAGGEVFGGQRILVPLHAMFDNVVDRTSLSTSLELNMLYGRESELLVSPPSEPLAFEETKMEAWKSAGPRPRPLPPPPARPKSYNVEGWWGWVAESDNEPDSTVIELRTNAHKLLWDAIDYFVSVEADAFISGFDRDGKGRPNFASLVMGHRLYHCASCLTYRLDRKEVSKLIEGIQDNLYQANQTWLSTARKQLKSSLLDGLKDAALKSKRLSFLSHPVPECSCSSSSSSSSSTISSSLNLQVAPGDLRTCPAWIRNGSSNSSWSSQLRDKETEEEIDDNFDSWSSGAFVRQPAGWNKELASSSSSDSGELNNKEESSMEDQEELEGGDR